MANQNVAGALGTANVGSLLLHYSIPAIVATVASSVYNIVDRIFIGQGVGPFAISGLALTLPLMNITAAFGAMVGVGASTMVSIRLGQHDRQGATRILGNTVMLNTIISVVVTIISLIFLEPILYGMGASPGTLPYARDFMQIILAGNVFLHLYLGLNNIMRASGYPRKAMIATLLTVAINIALAPLFIFVFKWGIRGAALATVLAQIFGTIWVFFHFMSPSHSIYFLPGYFKLKIKVIREIISIGIANFLMLTVASLVVVIINLGLEKHGGDLAIGAFGIINSIMNLIVFIVIGINQGMQPIAGYNYGAMQYDRVKHVFKLTVIAGTAISTIGFLLGEIFPRQISSLFTSNHELIGLSTNGMRIAVMMFPIVGIQMVTSSFFQSIGKAWISIFLSLSRQVLLLIPLVIILPHYFGLNGVWYSMPLSDLVSSLLTVLVLRKQLSGEVFQRSKVPRGF